MCVVVLLLLKNKFQHGAYLFVDIATSPDRSEQSFQAGCSNFAQMKISIKLCINKLSDAASKSSFKLIAKSLWIGELGTPDGLADSCVSSVMAFWNGTERLTN